MPPDLRPAARDDAAAILDVIVARDVADVGEPDYTLEDLHEEWDAAGFDLARDAVVIEDGGRVIGYAAVRDDMVQVSVHPDAEGRGAGAALLAWSERRAAERRHDRHRQDIGERNARAAELLRAHGYERVRSYWRMLVDTSGIRAVPPEPPAGITARVLDVDGDARALFDVDRRAFASVASYRGEPFERFVEEHLQAGTLDPGLSVVAEDDRGPVAFALCRRWADEGRGYIDLLAVDPSVAGRGIGSWLLFAVFARCRDAGLPQVMLGVAADNPRAVGLYERAGMRVHFRLDSYERDVATAGDSATAELRDQPPS